MARHVAVSGVQNGKPWRLAKSLIVLYDQIDAAHPNRNWTLGPDGTIGDAAHASRGSASDHNPWVMDGDTGVVTALDISHDPAHGVDTYKFFDFLIQSKDLRVKYIISNGEIVNSTVHSWEKRPYHGTNPHDRHIHFSVRPLKSLYDLTTPWALGPLAGATPDPDPTLPPLPHPDLPVLKYGSTGEYVGKAQDLLGIVSEFLPDDRTMWQRIKDAFAHKIPNFPRWFGPRTESAVKDFQRTHKLILDGIIGLHTWSELEASSSTSGSTPPVQKQINRSIIATVFGGLVDNQKSAYTNKLLLGGLYIALPYHFTGTRPRVTVVNRDNGKMGTGTIEDIGPWNVNDPYWTKPGSRPQAESGHDMTGRKTNLSGIDLSPDLAKQVGVAGRGVVDWYFE